MFKNSSLAFLFISLICVNNAFGQCVASAGLDIAICDGDGSSSNYTYLEVQVLQLTLERFTMNGPY